MSLINIDNVYRQALGYTLKRKYGYKIPNKVITRFNQQNSDLKDVCDYLDTNFDLQKKTKKDFLKVLDNYLSFYNRLFRTFKF